MNWFFNKISKFAFASAVLLLNGYSIFAQETEAFKPIRLLVRSSHGINIPISPLRGGYITDGLLAYDAQTFYLQIISGNYYFNNNLGIEVTIRHSVGDEMAVSHQGYEAAVADFYGGSYYVMPQNYESQSRNGLNKVMAGPTYKIERNKFVFITRLLVGAGFMDLNSRDVTLKEVGANQYFHIAHSSKTSYRAAFLSNPSFTLGYRIFKRVMLTADVDYSVFKPDIVYREIFTNLNTGESTGKFYRYNSAIQELSLGIGVSIILSQK